MWGWMLGGLALGAIQGAEAAEAQNEAAQRSQENTKRRYLLQKKQAEGMMEEQQGIRVEQMTAVSRSFLKAKGQSKTVQAETGVSGKVAQRMKFTERAKASEVKGKVSKEIETNIVNIANNMLTKKVDADAMIQEAQSRKQNVFTAAVMSGLGGAMTGAQFGSMMGAGGTTTQADAFTGVKPINVPTQTTGHGWQSPSFMPTTFGG